MATFIMFGKYSSEALNGISEDRTKQAKKLIERFKGKLNAIYVMLGEHDLMIVTEFPGIEEAMMASIMLNKLSGISFSTAPALSVEKFDKIATEID
ncbi:MAG: GYD domain-containing protein [Elusimicrobia bacterium]|nr:GYD domain-containing protein [Candidatus Liberimonas magnetica]